MIYNLSILLKRQAQNGRPYTVSTEYECTPSYFQKKKCQLAIKKFISLLSFLGYKRGNTFASIDRYDKFNM